MASVLPSCAILGAVGVGHRCDSALVAVLRIVPHKWEHMHACFENEWESRGCSGNEWEHTVLSWSCWLCCLVCVACVSHMVLMVEG